MREAEPALTKSLRDCFKRHLFFSVWQAEGDDVLAHGNRNILLVVKQVCHRRSMWGLTGWKAPKRLARPGVGRGKSTIVCTKEDYASRGAEHTAETFGR